MERDKILAFVILIQNDFEVMFGFREFRSISSNKRKPVKRGWAPRPPPGTYPSKVEPKAQACSFFFEALPKKKNQESGWINSIFVLTIALGTIIKSKTSFELVTRLISIESCCCCFVVVIFVGHKNLTLKFDQN